MLSPPGTAYVPTAKPLRLRCACTKGSRAQNAAHPCFVREALVSKGSATASSGTNQRRSARTTPALISSAAAAARKRVVAGIGAKKGSGAMEDVEAPDERQQHEEEHAEVESRIAKVWLLAKPQAELLGPRRRRRVHGHK